MTELNVGNFSDEPRTCGLTPDLASIQTASWLRSFFASYTPPPLCLRRSEQRLLLAAQGWGDRYRQRMSPRSADREMVTVAAIR
jgi:hypothetical protein